MRPEFPFFNVGRVHLPILFWGIVTVKQALALFVLRDMHKKPDNVGAIFVQVALLSDDRAVSLLPTSHAETIIGQRFSL